MESLGLDEVFCDCYDLISSDGTTWWTKPKNKSKSKIPFFFSFFSGSPITGNEGNANGVRSACFSRPPMPTTFDSNGAFSSSQAIYNAFSD